MNQERRSALKLGLGWGAALAGAWFTGLNTARAEGGFCGATPEQPEGPFYPVRRRLDEDNDLTRVKGSTRQAVGQVIHVGGVVSDDRCMPVAGAVVEIWQACSKGRYDHPGDQDNSAPLDPDFQYWGRCISDEQGRYVFRTVRPGAYPAGGGWMRPSHIHFKVHRRGFHELITQLYFDGDPYNADDRILRSLSPAERARVVVPLVDGNCRFDIALLAVR